MCLLVSERDGSYIGSGTITFPELVSKLMTKDYTGKTWNVLVDERNENRTKAAGIIPQVLQPLGHRKLGSHERLCCCFYK